MFSTLVKKKYIDFEKLAPLFPIALLILVCDFFLQNVSFFRCTWQHSKNACTSIQVTQESIAWSCVGRILELSDRAWGKCFAFLCVAGVETNKKYSEIKQYSLNMY